MTSCLSGLLAAFLAAHSTADQPFFKDVIRFPLLPGGEHDLGPVEVPGGQGLAVGERAGAGQLGEDVAEVAWYGLQLLARAVSIRL